MGIDPVTNMATRTSPLPAASALIFGAGSLLLFGAFLYTGAFGVVNMRLSQAEALIWDAGLCLLFFLQHSAMVRRSFRARLRKLAPANSHGIIYSIASGVALILLVAGWQPSSAIIYSLPSAGRWVVRIVLLFALAGSVWGFRSLREFDVFGIAAFRSGVNRERTCTVVLTIAGPYKLVRHPFYFCAVLALWAVPVLSLDRLVLNALFTLWIVLGAILEERDLVAEFGDAYSRYQSTVPMLLPRI